MKLKVTEITMPPAGPPSRKGFVWSPVSVRFEDEETQMMPSIIITVHVPVAQSDTFWSGARIGTEPRSGRLASRF